MTIKIGKRKFIYCLALFFIIYYAFSSGLEKYTYGGKTILIYCSLLFAVGLIVQQSFYSIKWYPINICAIFMGLIVMLNRNQNQANGIYINTLAMWVGISFFIFMQTNSKWHKAARYLLTFVGLFFAFFTIAFMFTPEFYCSRVATLFSGYTYALLRQYKNGFMPGLAFHYSANGIYLSVGLSVLGSYLLNIRFQNKSKIKKIVMVFLFLFVLFALFMTAKRAHIIFSMFVLLVCYYFLHSDQPVRRWYKILFAVMLAVVALMVISQFVPTVLNFVYRFYESAAAGDITLGRETQVITALGQFFHNPLLGIGWDGFKYWYKATTGTYVNVHCVYVQLLCENGLIGSIPFYTFFIVELHHIIKVFKYYIQRKVHFSQDAHIAITFSLYIQIFFLLYCFTGNPLYDAPIFFPYMFACSIGEYYFRKSKKEEKV